MRQRIRCVSLAMTKLKPQNSMRADSFADSHLSRRVTRRSTARATANCSGVRGPRANSYQATALMKTSAPIRLWFVTRFEQSKRAGAFERFEPRFELENALFASRHFFEEAGNELMFDLM